MSYDTSNLPGGRHRVRRAAARGRRRIPLIGSEGGDIPVVYITVPPAATPKMIAVEFARFLGLPISRRSNITDITESVCGVCLDARVTAQPGRIGSG